MRCNKEVKNEMVKSAREMKQNYSNVIDDYIKELNLARSIEGIMLAKTRILTLLLGQLPTNCDSCYFCLLYDVNCRICKYAEHHGICTGKGSDFSKLRLAKQELMNILRNDYYKGEKY